jgi:uncharacterized protein (DUF2141 family)
MKSQESFGLPHDPHEKRQAPQAQEGVPEFDESKIDKERLRKAIEKAREGTKKGDDAEHSDDQ